MEHLSDIADTVKTWFGTAKAWFFQQPEQTRYLMLAGAGLLVLLILIRIVRRRRVKRRAANNDWDHTLSRVRT